MRKKVVLITGSNGFIGSHVVAELKGKCRLVGLDTDAVNHPGQTDEYVQMVLPNSDIEQVIRVVRPDYIVHMAGSANVALSLNHPGVDFQAGPVVVFQILDAIRKAGFESRFIFPSSAAVYGNPERLPVAENSRLAPISPYGFHKLLCETIIQEFHQIYGLPYVIMRIFSCYGAGLRKQLLWDVSEKIYRKRLELHGTGHETRDFIHVTDVARIVAMLVDKDVENLTINVANGQEITVRRIVGLLCDHLSKNGLQPEFNGQVRRGDPLHWKADISMLAGLGYEPELGMEKGIEDFAKWVAKECHAVDH